MYVFYRNTRPGLKSYRMYGVNSKDFERGPALLLMEMRGKRNETYHHHTVCDTYRLVGVDR